MPNEPRRHYAGEVTVCEKCAEPIIFLANNNTHKLAPITVASYPDGNCRHVVNTNQYQMLGKVNADAARSAGEKLSRNHFYGCPNAKHFERRTTR